jgi:hypothetical protein
VDSTIASYDHQFGSPQPHDEDYDSGRQPTRIGNLLIFLTSADHTKIGSFSERQRYITIGFLMLITAAQGFYAASLFTSIGFHKKFDQVLFYGLFFAVAVYLIDRSIIGYVAPAKVDATGRLAPTRKFTPIIIIRIIIAATAALLMSEMVLLQFFAPDITGQIRSDHITQISQQDARTNNIYQTQINILQHQINAASNNVGKRRLAYRAAVKESDCQEFGCPGITAGEGKGFNEAIRNENAAFSALQSAQRQYQQIFSQNAPNITKLNRARNASNNVNKEQTENANALLTREEAFWQLTVKFGTVAFWRIILTLLILGIDLAPLLTKLTGKTTMHDAIIRGDEHVAMDLNWESVDTRKRHNTECEQLRRVRNRTTIRSELQRLLADADVERLGIKLSADVRRRQLSRFYASGRSQSVPGRTPTAPFRGSPGAADSWDDSDGMLPADIPTYRHDAGRPHSEPDAGADGHDRGSFQSGNGAGYGHDQYASPVDAEASYAFDGLSPGLSDDADLLDHGFSQDSIGPGNTEVADILLSDSMDVRMVGGRWALLDKMRVEEGAGGVIWRAKDVADDSRWYVVKTLSARAAKSPESTISLQQRSYQSELRIKNVRSDHIGCITDNGKDGDLYYIVYPMYRPGSLSRCYPEDELHRTLERSADIVRQILTGLIDASAEGLVHLDIKPSNVVLDGSQVRIIDWGLSRFWQVQDSTYTAVARGSKFFASPEQLGRRTPDWDKPTADLFGVGAVFYWLITGEPPLRWDAGEKADMYTYAELIVQGVRPQQVHELVPGVPAQLSQLIDSWLSYDPAGRVPSGTMPEQALHQARDQLAAMAQHIPPIAVGMVTGRRRQARA